MGLALITGRGALPRAVAEAQTVPPLVCALSGHAPEGLVPDIVFRLERLGGLMARLRRRGVDRICLCGGIDRPRLSPFAFDLATLRLLPTIRRALRRGDDGALRLTVALFETAGFTVVGAHEAAPGLLPPAGVPTAAEPDGATRADVRAGDAILAEMGRADLGQACILRDGQALARERDSGTDAMIAGLGTAGRGAILFKAPKPGQDRRVDLPTIGPATAAAAVAAGLRGIVIEAGGVIVLDRDEVVRRLDAAGLFLWLRERQG
ncbi:LpxI family protein [Roseivivax isoporae]|uniref:Phosphatidate cytidylyltransferase n=1 Tax=Roseivivax isoporae LMG 25204 TaxID=1449351 RepID=X7FF99_9RHOB|nr:UDP-2,3-diacylglucosamine diphosphatase LpxI [Roseivivax isoporae]ETX30751.1 phosphatidate cytidylyltransferase [Roseivivax isoporae LMG 25204]